MFLRPKEEAYLAVKEDDRYYLVLTEEELALCHVLGATCVCAGAVLRTRLMDGCLPALYRGDDVAVRRHCLEVPVRAGSLGPFWWRRGPFAAPLVDCRAPFVYLAM